MIELSSGRWVYIYESHLTKAHSRKTPSATDCFLMSCFYKDSDLIGKSLTGKNGKECIDTDILENILSKGYYTLKCISIFIYFCSNYITCISLQEYLTIIP